MHTLNRHQRIEEVEVVPRQETPEVERRLICSAATYEEAERVVDILAKRDFPIDRIQITAHNVTLTEQVTGRRTMAESIGSHAFILAVYFAITGFFVGLVSAVEPAQSATSLAGLGALLGVFAGVVTASVARLVRKPGERFHAIDLVEADRFDVVCERLIDEMRAFEILADSSFAR